VVGMERAKNSKRIESRRINFLMPTDLVEKIDEYASANMLSRGQVISIGMRKFFQNEDFLKSLIKPNEIGKK
jgi:metal-responsive CopG/Arc/MetJ family transcriptional regulator